MPPFLQDILIFLLALLTLWNFRLDFPAGPPSQESYTTGTYLGHGPLDGDELIRLSNGQIVTAVSYGEQTALPGQRFIVEKLGQHYILDDPWRLDNLFWLLALLVGVVLWVTGRQGFRAIMGSTLTFAVLWWQLLPLLLRGNPPLSLLPALGVTLCISMYYVHGISIKTHAAVLSMLLCTLFGFGLLMLLNHTAYLTGLTSEGGIVVQASYRISALGLYLVSVLLSALGAMNDVAITQTSAIQRFRKAGLAGHELWKAGMQVGHDHAAGLVNVLVLLYTASSLSLLLLLRGNSQTSWWQILNSETFFSEVVSLLVSLLCMILVIPLSTALACWWPVKGVFSNGNGGRDRGKANL